MSRRNPKKDFAIVAAVCVVVLSLLGWRLHLHPLWAYLAGVSIVTFAFYGYDKAQAKKQGDRIPEVVLHLLTLSGGTIGALAGQAVFRHKTRKFSFKAVLLGIIAMQITAVAVYFKYLRHAG